MCVYDILLLSTYYSIQLRYGFSTWTPVRGGSGGAYKYAILQADEEIWFAKALFYKIKITEGWYYWYGDVLCALTFNTNMDRALEFNKCKGETKSVLLTKGGLLFISGRYGNYLNLLRLWGLSNKF